MQRTFQAITTDSGAGHISPAHALYEAHRERMRYWLEANDVAASTADRAAAYACFVMACEPVARLAALVTQIAGARAVEIIAAGAEHQAHEDQNAAGGRYAERQG